MNYWVHLVFPFVSVRGGTQSRTQYNPSSFHVTPFLNCGYYDQLPIWTDIRGDLEKDSKRGIFLQSKRTLLRSYFTGATCIMLQWSLFQGNTLHCCLLQGHDYWSNAKSWKQNFGQHRRLRWFWSIPRSPRCKWAFKPGSGANDTQVLKRLMEKKIGSNYMQDTFRAKDSKNTSPLLPFGEARIENH